LRVPFLFNLEDMARYLGKDEPLFVTIVPFVPQSLQTRSSSILYVCSLEDFFPYFFHPIECLGRRPVEGLVRQATFLKKQDELDGIRFPCHCQ